MLQKMSNKQVLITALFFTLAADYFLCFADYFTPGVFLFCLVQLCYNYYLHRTVNSFIASGLTGILLLSCLGILFKLPLDSTAFAAAFYFACLISNVFIAWRLIPDQFTFSITSLLFCDIHVGIYNLPLYLSVIPEPLLFYSRRLALYGIWLFYIPGLFLLISQISHLTFSTYNNTRDAE